MKSLFLFFSLTAFCFAVQDSAIVRFADGEELSGNIVDLNLQTLTLKSNLLKENADFKVEKIRDLELPAKLNLDSSSAASHEAILELTNKDKIKGQLIGLNDKEIHLKTWYADKMVFRRKNVKSITISGASKILYSGPTDMEGWKLLGDDSWQFNLNEFISKDDGGIGREVDFTDEVQITYDIAWTGTFTSKLLLFTPDINSTRPQSGYEITFERNLVGIRRLSDSNRLRSSSNPGRITPKDKVHMEFRISRPNNKIMLYMNDILYATWVDERMEETQGKGLIFLSDDDSDLKISNIRVSEWDGFVDEPTDENQAIDHPAIGMQFRRVAPVAPAKPRVLPQGRMLLANGDTMEGEVLEVDNDVVKVKTPFTDVKLPIERIKNIALNKETEEAIKKKGDVRAFLADGSSLVFRIDDVKDGKIVGYSQNFGNAEFLMSAFKRIEFNCHFRK